VAIALTALAAHAMITLDQTKNLHDDFAPACAHILVHVLSRRRPAASYRAAGSSACEIIDKHRLSQWRAEAKERM
jgi:hypothetical protein